MKRLYPFDYDFNRDAKHYTRSNTTEIEELTGNPIPRETYEATIKMIGSVRYDFFGTITFRYGGYSRDSLQGFVGRFNARIKKKCSKMRATYVFEEHRLMQTDSRRFHVHYLIEPCGLTIDAAKAFINPALRRIRTDGLRSIGVGKTDLREIYDQADLIDYLTKPLRFGDCRLLDIDYLNSDLRKFTDV